MGRVHEDGIVYDKGEYLANILDDKKKNILELIKVIQDNGLEDKIKNNKLYEIYKNELNSEVTSLIALFTNLTQLKLWIFTLSRVDSSSSISASVKGIDLVELHNLKNGVAKKIFKGVVIISLRVLKT